MEFDSINLAILLHYIDKNTEYLCPEELSGDNSFKFKEIYLDTIVDDFNNYTSRNNNHYKNVLSKSQIVFLFQKADEAEFIKTGFNIQENKNYVTCVTYQGYIFMESKINTKKLNDFSFTFA